MKTIGIFIYICAVAVKNEGAFKLDAVVRRTTCLYGRRGTENKHHIDIDTITYQYEGLKRHCIEPSCR